MAGDLAPRATPAANAGERTVRIPSDLEPYHGKLYDTVVSELECKLITAALRSAGGNQVRAAQLLGISRVMLHDRIKKYGIKAEIVIQPL